MTVPSSIASKVSLTLDLPPSCIQFCPAHPQYFVVGTYNLQTDEDEAAATTQEKPEDEDCGPTSKKPQSRNGTLVVFRVDGDELTKVQTVSQPSALLDIRFHESATEHRDILAVVSSTASLAIFKLDPKKNPSSPLEHLATSRCPDVAEDALFLQCAWHPEARDVIAVTTSPGAAILLTLDDEWKIKEFVDLDIHNSLEAWCIAFSPPSSQSHMSIYCGGDDSLMRYTSCSWDKTDIASTFQAPYGSMTIKGQHDAGVTAILPLPVFTKSGGRIVVTGSYDDHLRVLAIHDLHDSHGLKRVQSLVDENLGGGVWRLNLVDIKSTDDIPRIRILASCMHAGARMVEIGSDNGEDWHCRVLARFEEHKSMNYGCDFVPTASTDGRLTCISTSFYDRLLCLWEYGGEGEQP